MGSSSSLRAQSLGLQGIGFQGLGFAGLFMAKYRQKPTFSEAMRLPPETPNPHVLRFWSPPGAMILM